MPSSEEVRRQMLSPLTFKMFLLKKLPLAFVAGLKVEALDDEECRISVPYGWRTQNPFRSTYFAALSMAAELSTGLPADLAKRSSPESVSMLIVGMEGSFEKKAVARTVFTCSDVPRLRDAVRKASVRDEPVGVRVETVGRMPGDVLVARFAFEWSFKRRPPRKG